MKTFADSQCYAMQPCLFFKIDVLSPGGITIVQNLVTNGDNIDKLNDVYFSDRVIMKVSCEK